MRDPWGYEGDVAAGLARYAAAKMKQPYEGREEEYYAEYRARGGTAVVDYSPVSLMRQGPATKTQNETNTGRFAALG